MSKDKALATTQSTEVAVFDEQAMAAWGGNELSSKDIVIPSLLLMQQMSDFVSEGDGTTKMGDYVDSVTKENFGSKIEGIVPFHMEKTWTIELYNTKKSKFEYAMTEKMTLDNESLPYEFETAEGKFRRLYTYRFYVLIPGKLLPYMLKFKSSSKKAGSELSTEMFVKNKMKSLPPAATMITLSSKIEKNDDGTFAVKQITPGNRTPYESVLEALNWFKTIRQSDKVVVDDKDL